jgi:signal transduction histidine kinase
MEMMELRGEDCVITTAIDITDKTKAEDRLKSYTDLLEQKVTERTLELTHALEREKEVSDMKSRFVSIASHEFRTPLSTILSSTYLLEQIKDNEAEKNKHFNRIRSAVKNLTFILTEFLSLDKLEQQKVTIENELFDISVLASEVVDEVKIAHRLTLPIDYIHTGPKLLIQDKRIVRNVLLNVVSNAAKYSPPDKIMMLKTEVNQEKLVIHVKDQGIGIPLADQRFIFTKFFRASNANHIQGTGLGLSIAKRYIELMDGTIQFKSTPGIGTEFEIVLPL